MGILDRARALLWPDRCILCGGVVAYGEDCCRRCREQGLLLREPERRMGLEVAAVWPYRAAAGAVRRFKFQGDMETGRKLARRMAWAWRRQRSGFAADCITFVPMPEERLRQRGYNQAELLARWVGERLGQKKVSTASRTVPVAASTTGISRHLSKAVHGWDSPSVTTSPIASCAVPAGRRKAC